MPAHTLVLVFATWLLGFLVLSQLALAVFALARGRRRRALRKAERRRRFSGRPPAFATPAGEFHGGAPGMPALGVVSEPDVQDALNAWEGEGGSARPRAPEAGGRGGDASAVALPAGHTARLAWGFADQAGRFSYEFYRVYGPAGRLNPDLSYWVVRSRTATGAASQRWSGWRMSYARARALAGPGLTFERFASPAGIPDEPEADAPAPRAGGAPS
ncbi:MAG TPA: hypothetical protein VFS43_47200 [Polyangiaceae bacterium]|nr:hypothetical protein [Polyangiaceae bacterium]